MNRGYPKRPNKTDAECCNSSEDPHADTFDMVVFAWKEDYKSMKSRMDKYKSNESNVWALLYGQCLGWKCRQHVGDKAKRCQLLSRQANFGDMVYIVSAHFCVAIFPH